MSEQTSRDCHTSHPRGPWSAWDDDHMETVGRGDTLLQHAGTLLDAYAAARAATHADTDAAAGWIAQWEADCGIAFVRQMVLEAVGLPVAPAGAACSVTIGARWAALVRPRWGGLLFSLRRLR